MCRNPPACTCRCSQDVQGARTPHHTFPTSIPSCPSQQYTRDRVHCSHRAPAGYCARNGPLPASSAGNPTGTPLRPPFPSPSAKCPSSARHNHSPPAAEAPFHGMTPKAAARHTPPIPHFLLPQRRHPQHFPPLMPRLSAQLHHLPHLQQVRRRQFRQQQQIPPPQGAACPVRAARR